MGVYSIHLRGPIRICGRRDPRSVFESFQALQV
jgi:hypothetical protein